PELFALPLSGKISSTAHCIDPSYSPFARDFESSSNRLSIGLSFRENGEFTDRFAGRRCCPDPTRLAESKPPRIPCPAQPSLHSRPVAFRTQGSSFQRFRR